MLHAGGLGHEDRQAESDRSPDAVLQPDGVPPCIRAGTLLRGRQRGREPFGLVTEEPVPPTSPLRGGGEVDVPRDLGDDEAQLLGSEPRIQSRDDRAHLRLVRRCGGAVRQPHGGAPLERTQPGHQPATRLAKALGAAFGPVEEIGAAFEHRGTRRLHHADAPVELRPVPSRSGPGDDRVQPPQLVDKPDDGPRGGAEAGRAVGRRQEHRFQLRDRVGRRGHRGVVLGLGSGVAGLGGGDLGAQPCGECPARPDRRVAQRIPCRRRPQQRDRHQGRACRQAPARQPVRDRRDGAGQRHGQDEGQQQRRGRAGQDRADDPCKEHAEGDGCHGDHGEWRRPRDDRAEADQDAPREGERGLGLEPIAHRAREVDEREHGERPERGEGGQRRVPDQLVADREHRRHDDRGPRGPAERREARIVLAEPERHADNLARRGAREVSCEQDIYYVD